MALRFTGTFQLIDDTPSPDVKIAPTSGQFTFDVGTGTELKARLAAVLQPLIDAEAAHLAQLQAALLQANS